MGAIFYTFLPYHFSLDLLYRQAHTETASYIWVPLVFWAMDKSIKNEKAAPLLASSYALLILTHLPTALMGSFFIGIYMMMRSWSRRSLKLYAYFTVSILIGILLSACYLIPAVSTQDQIHAHLWWTQHFDYSAWLFFDGKPAPDPLLNALLNNILVYNALAFGIACLILAATNIRMRTVLLPMIAIFLGTWFLMTPVSVFFWELIPIIKKVQFPWRALVFQDFSIAVIVSLATISLTKVKRIWASITCVILYAVLLISSISFAISAYRPHQALWGDIEKQRMLEARAQFGAGARPHFPIAIKIDFQSFLDSLPKERVTLFNITGDVTIKHWKPRDISLQFNLQEETLVTVKQIYFKGWEATNSMGESIPIIPHPHFGLIQFIAKPGDYAVELRLKPLASEKLGWSATQVGFVLLLSMFAMGYRKS